MRTREKIMASYPGTRFAVLGVLLALCLTTCGTPKAQESKSPEESLKNSALAVSVAGDYRESKDPGGGGGCWGGARRPRAEEDCCIQRYGVMMESI